MLIEYALELFNLDDDELIFKLLSVILEDTLD